MAAISKRHAEILSILSDGGTVSVLDLAERLKVSVETIRRDLRPLSDRGTVLKMHGAVGLARWTGEAPFERRMRENASAKQRIAAALATTVRNGDTLMIDTGTTTSFLARALLHHERLTVVTNSTDIARALSGRGGCRVLLTGGAVNADSGAVLGHDAEAFAAQYDVDHAVISAGAVNLHGVMDFEPDEAAFARAVLARGRRKVVVSDATKFGRSAFVKVCEFEGFHELYSDAAPDAAIAGPLAEAGVRVQIARPE